MKYYMPRYYFFLRRGHFGKRSLMRHMRWTLLVAPVATPNRIDFFLSGSAGSASQGFGAPAQTTPAKPTSGMKC